MRRPDVDRSSLDPLKRLRRDHEELVRAVSRGAPGLVDPSGNQITMVDAPTATQVAIGQDVGTSFSNGVATVVDATGTQRRDSAVRHLDVAGGAALAGGATVSGGATMSGGATLDGATCTGTVTSEWFRSHSVFMNGSQVGVPGGNVTTDPNGSMNSLQYYGGTFNGTFNNTSDETLKHRFAAVRDADLNALLTAPVTSWEYRHGHDQAHALAGGGSLGGTPHAEISHAHRMRLAAGRHIGMVAQHAPELIQRPGEDGHLGLDLASQVGLLQALAQRQDRELRDLRARLEQLEGRR